MTRPSPPDLPTRHGVGPSCVSLPPDPSGQWPTITEFLVERFPAIARPVWLARMADGLVHDELGQPVTAARAYQGHIRIYYYRALAAEPRIPFDEAIVFQDAHLVVADKPHFLPVTPSGHYLQETLLVRLKNRLNIDTLTPLHRIDRETAGLVMFSVRPQDRNAYQTLFRQHTIDKYYEAIAPWSVQALGTPDDGPAMNVPITRHSRIEQGLPFFRQHEVPGPANSHTHIDVLDICGHLARYALRPVTGKKHQLRVHMNALGRPIVNDRIYPWRDHMPDDDFNQPLQLLAKSVTFTDPVTGQARQFQSPRALTWPCSQNSGLPTGKP